jgi:Domain of unknown function (DUF4389)
MSTPTTPVHVRASLDPHLSRWLWLVKWLLAVPHYFVLAFLWLAFIVLSVVAMVAILFTGRYPRSIFDFNVGVLRWSWRVAYYTYGALGTDQYPPFSLAEVPEYPAKFSVDYPEHLSQGLVLVKWWLLAVPHYLIVGLLVSGTYFTAQGWDSNQEWRSGTGLIGILVLIAAVALLFTGRYPRSLFDLIIGLNRWVLRVAAYSALMTDTYPPFRLDMGPDDPGPGSVALRSSGGTPLSPPTAPVTDAPRPTQGAPGEGMPGPAQGVPQPPTGRWSAGRITALVLGCVLVLAGTAAAVAGVVGVAFDRAARDSSGLLMTASAPLSSSGYAVSSETAQLQFPEVGPFTADRFLGRVRITVTPTGGQPAFVGIGRSADVAGYLSGVQHSVLSRFGTGLGRDTVPLYRQVPGGAPAQSPSAANVWVADASGAGRQTLDWVAESGDWTIVVMNADASAGVQTDVRIGATFPSLGTAAGIVLLVAALLLVAGFVTVALSLRGNPRVGPGV